MAPVNKTKYAILGVLSLMPGSSGYDIKKFCDQGIAHFWNENYGHLYPVLRQMEAEGLIEGKTEQSPGNPPRKIYFVTAEGHDVLLDWLKQPPERQPLRVEPLLKLFFGGFLPLDKVLKMLAELREMHARALERFLEIERATGKRQGCVDRYLPFQLATLRFGQSDTQARIRWCDETMAELARLQETKATDGDGDDEG